MPSRRCGRRCGVRSCWVRSWSATRQGGIAERVIGPLARASLENSLQRGQAALTGPVARGDAIAVAGHLRALAEVDPQLAQAYRANSLRTAQRAHAPKEVFAVFSDSSGQP